MYPVMFKKNFFFISKDAAGPNDKNSLYPGPAPVFLQCFPYSKGCQHF